MADKFLQEGDVFMLTDGMKVTTLVPRHFAEHHAKGDFTLVRGHVYPTEALAYLQGRYITIRTEMTGGTHGSGNANNNEPDGYRVTAMRDDNKFQIEFYQSGWSPNLVTDVPVIARATQHWVIQDGQKGPTAGVHHG